MLRTAALLVMATAGFGATYAVVPIQTPTGSANVSMGGINNAGQVAVNASEGLFIGTPSAVSPVPSPAGWTSVGAFAINSSGQVAGIANNGPVYVAFIGGTSGSAVVPFPSSLSPGGLTSTGNALNDAGQVVGTIFGVPFAPPAFLGTTLASALFPSPGFGGGQPAVVPNAVNNSGLVAGAIETTYFLSGSAGNVSGYQEFIGTPAGVTLVPSPAGYNSAEPWAINASGQVAGVASSDLGTLFISEQAFIGTAAGSTLIPFPVGASISRVGGQSINDRGTVVGRSNAGGWIWDATNGTRLLNTLVPSGWNVTNGISISNNGLILAQASYQGGAAQYVELTPSLPATPAPSTLVLLVIGAMFSWTVSKR